MTGERKTFAGYYYNIVEDNTAGEAKYRIKS